MSTQLDMLPDNWASLPDDKLAELLEWAKSYDDHNKQVSRLAAAEEAMSGVIMNKIAEEIIRRDKADRDAHHDHLRAKAGLS